MIKVTNDDIGRAVIYRPPGSLPRDEGISVAFTEHPAFVRYIGEQFSKATKSHDLDYKGA
jgi:hypothetical protein